MTRKDYVNIAAAILATQVRIKAQCSYADTDEHKRDTDQQLRGVRRVAAHLADFLRDDNPRGFDPVMFLKNCGYGGTPTGRTKTSEPNIQRLSPGVKGDDAITVAYMRGDHLNAERPTALNLSALERAYDEGRASFASGAPCPYNIATPAMTRGNGTLAVGLVLGAAASFGAAMHFDQPILALAGIALWATASLIVIGSMT